MGQEHICIGAIAGAFGVTGEVRLKSFCSEPSDIATYGPLSSEDGSRQFRITLTKPVTGGFGARIQGVTTREAAEALRGTSLYVPRDRLPQSRRWGHHRNILDPSQISPAFALYQGDRAQCRSFGGSPYRRSSRRNRIVRVPAAPAGSWKGIGHADPHPPSESGNRPFVCRAAFRRD
jgi:hypothetical protein